MADSNESVGPTIVPPSDTRFASAYPRPDGYSGHTHFPQPTKYSITGANGYIGDSEIAARADHVHPLNFCSSKPRPIGIPYGGSGSIGYQETGEKDFGLFGRIGIPPFGGTGHYISHEVTNSYALSNHVHPYGFCLPTSTSNSSRPYNTFPDGANNRFSSVVLTTNGTVTPVYYWLTPQPSGTDTTLKFGNSGVCPYPARLDHTHPLNVVDLHDTGAKAEDYIKPIGYTVNDNATPNDSQFGTGNTYARVDHVHPFPITTTVTGDRKTISDSELPVVSPTTLAGQDDTSVWDNSSGNMKNGISIQVCTRVFHGSSSGVPNPYDVLYFREFKFNKYGMLINVGPESHAFRICNFRGYLNLSTQGT